jgi:hypothetical protein
MFHRNILCPSSGETKTDVSQKPLHTPNNLHGLRAVSLCESLKIKGLKFRKVAKIDYERRHVCPSVRMEQLGSHHTDFCEVLD